MVRWLQQMIFILVLGLTMQISIVWAGKLAIVIDDFGYRPGYENQILALPAVVSVSVLPNAPYARKMAIKAHQLGHEVLIHLPMAPLSQQPLEKDTLFPDMSESEIHRIIQQAINQVPYAVGMNNHMGSAMTSDLHGMQKIMRILADYPIFFLDSRTISTSKVKQAAMIFGVPVISRDVFLDDKQDEMAIRQQFHRAVMLARRQGFAIAIGHPHPVTVRVLQQMLMHLPADIQIVTVDSLLKQSSLSQTVRIGVCPSKYSISQVSAKQFFALLWDSFNEWMQYKFSAETPDLQKK